MQRVSSLVGLGLAFVVYIALSVHRTNLRGSQFSTKRTFRVLQQAVSQNCTNGTTTVNEYLGVLDALQEIDTWHATQGTDVICTEATATKTTCFLNYTAAPDLLDSCESVGAAFVKTTSIFQCSKKDGNTLYYTSDSKPACYDASCQSAEIATMEDQTSNFIMESLIADNIVSCTRVRFATSSPIYPSESGNAQQGHNCQDETNVTMSMLNDTEAVTQNVLNTMKSTCTVKQNAKDKVWGNAKYQECEADFSENSQSMNENCQSVGGLFFELDYSMACQHPSQDPMTVSVVSDPLCASKSFCTMDQVDEVATNYTQRLFFVSDPSQWNCTLLDIKITDFLASTSPTISPAPSVSPAPTAAPTITPAPTMSAAPTVESSEGNCWKNSASLNATKSIQDILLALSPSDQVCQLNTTNASNSTTNVRSLQSGKPCQVVEYNPSKDVVNRSNLQSICDGLDGLYVEEIFTIKCVSSADGSVTAEKRIHNKPACRHRACNGVEMKQVLFREENWLVSSMEVENGGSCYIQNIQILAKVGNIDGFLPDGSLPPGFQLSDECRQESDNLETIIAIYNERQRIVKNFEAYTQVDMRQICTSPIPGILNCYFDWEDFAQTTSSINMETLCNQNGGQFLTGEFTTVCSKATDDQVMNMFSSNVPQCLGLSCSTGQAELYLMDSDDDWITHQFKDEDWECNTTVTSVFTPNYLTAEERANFTAAPTQAPDPPTNAPITVAPVPSPTANEGDESDPLQHSSTAGPSPTESMSASSNNQDDSGGLSIGAIVGIVIGAFVLCLCCVALRYGTKRGSDRRYGASKTKYRGSHDGVDFDDEVGANEDSDVYDWETNDDEEGGDREHFEDDSIRNEDDDEEEEDETRSGSDEVDDDEWDDDSGSYGEEEEGSTDDESVEYK